MKGGREGEERRKGKVFLAHTRVTFWIVVNM